MTGILHRRSKAAMKALREQMRELEARGVPRKRIALEVGATPAQVTRGLGPVRSWRERRLADVPHETLRQKLSKQDA